MKIPLGKPVLGIEENSALLRVLKGGYLASHEMVREFENALAKRFQRKYCVVVNSGASALYLSLKASGVKKVIVPSVTCVNVLHAVLNAGLKPIFADIEEETHNIDLSTLSREQLDEADGLVVTHTYGHAADMAAVASYTRDFNLSLIEDFAQATGGCFQGRILGNFGRVSITSFYDTKPMSTGQGGAIFTDDLEIYQKCLYARGERVDYYYGDIVPMNLKMSGIQAAVGLVQLKKLDNMVEMRRNVARQLTTLLSHLDLKLPTEKPDVKPTYYKYHLVLPEYIPKYDFVKEMSQSDISVGICYDPPLHKTWLAKNVLNTDINLPVSENVVPRTVSLPIFPGLKESDISRICHAIASIFQRCRNTVQLKRREL